MPKKLEEPEKEYVARMSRQVWEDLTRQAKILGYLGGTTMIYIRDRLAQMADDRIFNILPPVTPSWPPDGPGTRKDRGRKPKRWFVLEESELRRRRAA